MVLRFRWVVKMVYVVATAVGENGTEGVGKTKEREPRAGTRSATDKPAGTASIANSLASELALRLEIVGIRDVDVLHVPGSLHKSAETLRAVPNEEASSSTMRVSGGVFLEPRASVANSA